MNDEPKPGTGTEAWFKELENRLERVGSRLADAALQATHSVMKGAEIDRHLSVVQELVARIEDRVATLLTQAAGGQATVSRSEGQDAIEYREVPGFSGYRAGSDGRIWGARRAGRGYGRTREWRALKPYLVRPGPALTVSLYRDRVRYPLRVDAVVMLAFAGECPEGSEVEHANGDSLDNRLENLRYVASRSRQS